MSQKLDSIYIPCMHSTQFDTAGDPVPAAPVTVGLSDTPAAVPRRWVPFWAAVAILVLASAIPVALGILAPDRDPNAIGFVEQVSLTVEGNEGPRALGGYVAPEGWLWIDAQARDSFTSPDGQVLVTGRLLAGVEDPERELRAAAATGSALLPVAVSTTASGLASYTLSEDLAAGGEVTERTFVCSAAATSRSCFEFVIVDAQNETWDSALRALIDSVEVL